MCSNAAHTTTPTIISVSGQVSLHARAAALPGRRDHQRRHRVRRRVQPARQPRQASTRSTPALSTNYWEAGAKLDAIADSARNIYTADPTTRRRASTSPRRTPPTWSPRCGATDVAQAPAVIDWVRSARFGVGNPGISPTRLGAIESSTPAILTAALASLLVPVLVAQRPRPRRRVHRPPTRRACPWSSSGSMDGMIHAFYTIVDEHRRSPQRQRGVGLHPAEDRRRACCADYTASLGGDHHDRFVSGRLADAGRHQESRRHHRDDRDRRERQRRQEHRRLRRHRGPSTPSPEASSGPSRCGARCPATRRPVRPRASPRSRACSIGGFEKYMVIAGDRHRDRQRLAAVERRPHRRRLRRPDRLPVLEVPHAVPGDERHHRPSRPTTRSSRARRRSTATSIASCSPTTAATSTRSIPPRISRAARTATPGSAHAGRHRLRA